MFEIASSFYEDVVRHDFEMRLLREGEKEQNLVLQFNRSPPIKMLVDYLWDHRGERVGASLLLCAIADDLPPEVAAAGHNRCIVPLKACNVRAWLTPEGRSREELYNLVDDRERPYYQHEMAA